MDTRGQQTLLTAAKSLAPAFRCGEPLFLSPRRCFRSRTLEQPARFHHVQHQVYRSLGAETHPELDAAAHMIALARRDEQRQAQGRGSNQQRNESVRQCRGRERPLQEVSGGRGAPQELSVVLINHPRFPAGQRTCSEWKEPPHTISQPRQHDVLSQGTQTRIQDRGEVRKIYCGVRPIVQQGGNRSSTESWFWTRSRCCERRDALSVGSSRGRSLVQ